MFKALFLPTAAAALASASVSLGMAHPSSAADIAFPLSTSEPEPASRNTSRDHSAAIHVVNRASDGLFYVHAKVNGTPIRFVVDTGSNVVVLSAADARLAGLSGSARSAIAMQTAGGMSGVRTHRIKKLDVAGQSLTEVAAATAGQGLTVSLLGQSALSRLKSVKLEGNQLELN